MDVTIAVVELVRDEGTIVVFRGIDEDGAEVTFACEHRPAQDIVAAIERGEDPEAVVPDFMLLGRTVHPGVTP